jgi:hypothetical protein
MLIHELIRGSLDFSVRYVPEAGVEMYIPRVGSGPKIASCPSQLSVFFGGNKLSLVKNELAGTTRNRR